MSSSSSSENTRVAWKLESEEFFYYCFFKKRSINSKSFHFQRAKYHDMLCVCENREKISFLPLPLQVSLIFSLSFVLLFDVWKVFFCAAPFATHTMALKFDQWTNGSTRHSWGSLSALTELKLTGNSPRKIQHNNGAIRNNHKCSSKFANSMCRIFTACSHPFYLCSRSASTIHHKFILINLSKCKQFSSFELFFISEEEKVLFFGNKDEK